MRRLPWRLRTAPSATRNLSREPTPVIIDEATFKRQQGAKKGDRSTTTETTENGEKPNMHDDNSRDAGARGSGTFSDAFRRLFGGGSEATGSSMDRVLGQRNTASVNTTSSVSVPPRSTLFVPCHNLKALHKITSLNADCYILDLEDAVPMSRKQEARQNLYEFLSAQNQNNDNEGVDEGNLTKKKAQRFVVRVNSPRTDPANGFVDLDLVGTLHNWIEGVGIPKTLAGDLPILQPILCPTHELWAFFETPMSILEAPEICRQAVQQGGLPWRYAVMGLNDLANDMGLPLRRSASSEKGQASVEETQAAAVEPFGSHRAAFQYAMSTVVTAATAYGLHPIDGVCNDPHDAVLLEKELREAKCLGFIGKTLIHPAQIAKCHEWMTPSEGDVQWAQKVVEAAAAQANRQGGGGGGAFSVEGKMVEDLHVKQAQRTLDRWNLSQSK